MNIDTTSSASSLFLEAVYFAGGIRSEFYGPIVRPSWLPTIDGIGLHNDVYLTQGQFAVELSRHTLTDGRSSPGATWLGIYRHGSDLYGDRGNYFGIGVWCADGLVVDVERVLPSLWELLDLLADSMPKSPAESLAHEFSDNCRKLLAWFWEKGIVLGSLKGRAGISYEGGYSPSRAYVLLEDKLDQGSIGGLADAIDFLCLTEVKIDASCVLFVAGDNNSIDGKVPERSRFRGIYGLPGYSKRRLALVNTLVDSLSRVDESSERENWAAGKAAALAEACDKLQAELKEASEKLEAQRALALIDAGPAPSSPVVNAPPVESNDCKPGGSIGSSSQQKKGKSLGSGADGAQILKRLGSMESTIGSLRNELKDMRELQSKSLERVGVPWVWLAVSVLAGLIVGALGGYFGGKI